MLTSSFPNTLDYDQIMRKAGSREVYIPRNEDKKVIKIESLEAILDYSTVSLSPLDVIRHQIISKIVFSKSTLGNKVTYLSADATIEKSEDKTVIVYSEKFLPQYYQTAIGFDLCFPEVYKIKNLLPWYQSILDTEGVFRSESIFDGLLANNLNDTANIASMIESDMDLWSVLFDFVNMTREYFKQTRCVLDLTGSKNVFVRVIDQDVELVISNSAAKAYFNIDSVQPCHRSTKSTPIPGYICNLLDSTIWMNLICLLLEEEPIYTVDDISSFYC
jgi:hypothetical protein